MPVESRNGYSDSSSNDTLRKYSEDHCRKHLADLVEADEETETTGAMPYDRLARVQRKVSTSSTYSLASLEALWEKHPRRLSEAGLRRSSDHSVVLTEDTDSFIIGDRVWVGGSKPGQIAYIGETQFAPGEWAGIVLDDPIGKNDGSVAGTRYFQCSERRGVFSRLTRLTRTPLAGSPASEAGDAGERPRSAARARRSGSPQGSVRSVFSSKMNSSINSSFASGELKLGERVIVSSSQGSKAGTLRFVGATDFATGSWCGVELDDPIGKNDGSVEGKRYFECAPRFGLFAPVSKVSRSPSNRKPGVCAIHSRNGAATPLRRSSSRDSLTSLGTSLASSRVAPRSVVRLGVTSLAGAQVGWTPSREALRRREPPRASSEPSLLTLDDLRDKTLLVRDIDERRCCVDVLREPRVCIDVSAKVSKSSSRKSDSSSQPLNWLVSKNACFYHSSRASCANKHSIKLKARAKSASNRRIKPSPELVYEITLKQVKLRKWKSEVLLKNSRWSSSEGSQSDWTPGGELVTVHGRPAVYARTSHVGAGQSANLYIDLPPRPHTYFSNFGKSYHYSCTSPFEFKFPYIVYI